MFYGCLKGCFVGIILGFSLALLSVSWVWLEMRINTGLVNFGAFYAILKAMEIGPLSIIIPVVGMSFVIANILAFIVYREKLTWLKVTGILLTVSSLFLIKLGQS